MKSVNRYENLLKERRFKEIESNDYNGLGKTYSLDQSLGGGEYWQYSRDRLYNISIHNFYYHDDTIIDFEIPESLNITYYESVSGEQLCPYCRLEAGIIKTFISGDTPYKAIMHRKVPIKSISIEIYPEYYKRYLYEKYPNQHINIVEAFNSINKCPYFPEMILLLNQIGKYRGTSDTGNIFFDAKVNEAIALIIDKSKEAESKQVVSLSDKDELLLKTIGAYIDDHFPCNITLDELAKIGCMGTTKLKLKFKQYYGVTITKYIQNKRISHGEHLLSHTDININQIAKTVGYNSASRFAELFKQSIGMLPNEYRKILKN